MLLLFLLQYKDSCPYNNKITGKARPHLLVLLIQEREHKCFLEFFCTLVLIQKRIFNKKNSVEFYPPDPCNYWWRREDSNLRQVPYESTALPLSYAAHLEINQLKRSIIAFAILYSINVSRFSIKA